MNLNIPSELLVFIRLLAGRLGSSPQHYLPAEKFRALIYEAAEEYRIEFVPLDRVEEFYTMVVAAMQDGEKAGRESYEKACVVVQTANEKLQASTPQPFTKEDVLMPQRWAVTATIVTRKYIGAFEGVTKEDAIKRAAESPEAPKDGDGAYNLVARWGYEPAAIGFMAEEAEGLAE